MAHAFVLIMAVMVFVNVLVYVCMHPILWFLRVPQEVMEEMQQSVMNFGILMVQGLVNSFGATTMAAFAAAVKIDTKPDSKEACGYCFDRNIMCYHDEEQNRQRRPWPTAGWSRRFSR